MSSSRKVEDWLVANPLAIIPVAPLDLTEKIWKNRILLNNKYWSEKEFKSIFNLDQGWFGLKKLWSIPEDFNSTFFSFHNSISSRIYYLLVSLVKKRPQIKFSGQNFSVENILFLTWCVLSSKKILVTPPKGSNVTASSRTHDMFKIVLFF